MTIAEMRERGNSLISRVPADLLMVGVVVLFSTASFGLGVLYERDQAAKKGKDAGFWIEDVSTSTPMAKHLPVEPAAAVLAHPIPVVSAGTPITPAEGVYVGSKTGTKYYLPTCSSAKRIKEENKVWFATKADAEAAGRTPGVNCPGL